MLNLAHWFPWEEEKTITYINKSTILDPEELALTLVISLSFSKWGMVLLVAKSKSNKLSIQILNCGYHTTIEILKS